MQQNLRTVLPFLLSLLLVMRVNIWSYTEFVWTFWHNLFYRLFNFDVCFFFIKERKNKKHMWRYQTALILFQGGETRSAPFCEGRVDISTYFFLNKVRIGFVCDISLWLTFNVEYYDRRWNLQVCEDCFSLYRDPEIYSVCRYYMFTVFSSRYRSSIQCTAFSMPLYVGAVFSVQYLVCCTQFAKYSVCRCNVTLKIGYLGV